MKRIRNGIILAPLLLLLIVWFLTQTQTGTDTQPQREIKVGEDIREWFPNRRIDLITLQQRNCPSAPFLVPSAGYVGLFYNDPSRPYSNAVRHQGIDLFIATEPGTVPVYAVYDGYITHRRDWQSAVIQRIPSDPLNPGQQIWVYYTHMADEDGNDFIEPAFDYGAYEVFVEKGTLLGYVGDYDGNQPSRITPHLHLSIIRDDGNGQYLNELDVANTLDPSPYFGAAVKWDSAEINNPACAAPEN